MQSFFSSTLLLTLLLAIGLGFFLRAASKDRTTVLDFSSSLPPVDLLNGISHWLEDRGWTRKGGDADRQLLVFNGNVSSSKWLELLLILLGGIGSGCLGLVIIQLYPALHWWPLLLSIIGGPLSGFLYRKRAARQENLEIRLLTSDENLVSVLRVRAHRDELIAMETDLGEKLNLASDGSLLSSPI